MTRIERWLEAHGFVWTGLDRVAIRDAFLREMEEGLAGRASSLQMIDSKLRVDGDLLRDAPAVVLDAGGTNLRTARAVLPRDGSGLRFDGVVRGAMPGTAGRITADEMFRTLADGIHRFSPDAATRIGFCFSYACESLDDGDARLLSWSKGVDVPDATGLSVGAELARRLPAPPARLVVLNDTVATLLAGRVAAGDGFSSYAGFILGTGTNAAYLERGVAVNAESGEFDKLARSAFDLEMDAATCDPGKAVFEKMISGGYQGPLGTVVLRRAAADGFFSSGTAARLATRDLSARELEDPPAELFRDDAERATAADLVRPVFARAAILTGAHLAAFIQRARSAAAGRNGPVCVTVDGSTYYKCRAVDFTRVVPAEIDRLLAGTGVDYRLVKVADAPLAGAAAAALADAN